jgi:hypothetical protein
MISDREAKEPDTPSPVFFVSMASKELRLQEQSPEIKKRQQGWRYAE